MTALSDWGGNGFCWRTEVAPLRGAVLWAREPEVYARRRPPANLWQPWRVDLNLLGLDPRRGRRD